MEYYKAKVNLVKPEENKNDQSFSNKILLYYLAVILHQTQVINLGGKSCNYI